MYLSATLLLLLGASSSAQQWMFGVFTACVTENKSLRLECYYAPCPGSPEFDCRFTLADSSSSPGRKTAEKRCQLQLKHHALLYANQTTTYNCTLTRQGRAEEKSIRINYGIRKGKEHIKPCPGTIGLLFHRIPALIWPTAILSLYGVL